MPQVIFKPSGIIKEADEGSLLLDLVKASGISAEAPCGGHGVCHKCLAKVISGDVSFSNDSALSEEMLSQGYVLLCRTKLTDKPVTVQIISSFEKEQGKFSYLFDDMNLIDPSLLPKSGQYSPLVLDMTLNVPPPSTGDGLSDYDRFKRSILASIDAEDIDMPVSLLRQLPSAIRQSAGDLKVSYLLKNHIIHITDVEAPAPEQDRYGIAVDIGTTTVAVNLVSTDSGHILSSKTGYNAQIECGLDIISRINYAKRPDRLAELQSHVIKTINSLISESISETKISGKMIRSASVAGNTTMMHLLFGIMPEYIRLDPYTPAIYDIPPIRACEIGLDISPETYVYFAPAVGSYLGGDITSGLLCTDLSTETQEISLFIDIGTNGEIVLGNADFLLGCACSAGPAFEGGGIDKGMRASKGAIEYIEVDKETGAAVFNTIGNAEPIGICGSGIISLIAGLFSTGWLDAAGKLDRTRECPNIKADGKNASYHILDPEKTGRSRQIYITESDIDNFIRAKGAIFSACRVMLNKVHMDFSDLSAIYIAGGFGRYLNINDSITIGLLPDIDEDKFRFIGNSSLLGAYMTLLSEKHRENQRRLSRNITYLDLSVETEYMHEYTAALFLPHTDSMLFPGRK